MVQELYQGSPATLLGWERFGLCVPGYGSTEKATQTCWSSRGGALESGIWRLGFEGCIGVLEFSKGGILLILEWSSVYKGWELKLGIVHPGTTGVPHS